MSLKYHDSVKRVDVACSHQWAWETQESWLCLEIFWTRWFDAEQLLDYSDSDINQHIRLVSTTNIITNSNTQVKIH